MKTLKKKNYKKVELILVRKVRKLLNEIVLAPVSNINAIYANYPLAWASDQTNMTDKAKPQQKW